MGRQCYWCNQIKNLTVIVDFNKWQATGRSEEIMALTPLKENGLLVGMFRLMDMIIPLQCIQESAFKKTVSYNCTYYKR